jgi:hypothetical protein
VGRRARLEQLGEGVGRQARGDLPGQNRPVEAGEDPPTTGELARAAHEEGDAHGDATARLASRA